MIALSPATLISAAPDERWFRLARADDGRLCLESISNLAWRATRIVPHDRANCHTAKHVEGGDCRTRYEAHCSCGWSQGASSPKVAGALTIGHRGYSPQAAVIIISNP